MGNYTMFGRFENPRRGVQARNLTTNVPKILDLNSQIVFRTDVFQKLSLGAPVVIQYCQCVYRNPQTAKLEIGPACQRQIECFHMTSRRPYWFPKTMKRRPCWCPKPILWELKSFLMQTLFFVLVNLHRCWPRE